MITNIESILIFIKLFILLLKLKVSIIGVNY